MAGIDLQYLFGLGPLSIGAGRKHLFHFDGNGTPGGQASGMADQAGGHLNVSHLAFQGGFDLIHQLAVLVGGGIFFDAQVGVGDVFEFLVPIGVQHLDGEFIYILGEIQQLVALRQHPFGCRHQPDLFFGFAGAVVDILLILGHPVQIFLQGGVFSILGGGEQNQILQGFFIHPPIGIQAVF